jgi:DNA-directed RNA polymerase subunit RPC12/RpoP
MLKNNKIHRWLSGSFICKKCEREFHTMSFGYGEIICPDCYEGERRFITFDDGFWLNRIVAHKLISELHRIKPPSMGSKPLDKVHLKLEIANASEKARY